MKLDKLVKQLRRDATANPKKTALLGVMALVALYFWGPLLWKGVVAEKGKRAGRDQRTTLILTDDPVDTTAQTKTRTTNKFRWEKVRQLMEHDPRMVSATFEATWPDPFVGHVEIPRDVAATQTPEEAAAATAAAAVEEIGPSEAGLMFTGVVISPRRRTATISGEIYSENDSVSVTPKDHPNHVLEFKITRITRQAVELERDGRKYTLELSKSQLHHRDGIQWTRGQ